MAVRRGNFDWPRIRSKTGATADPAAGAIHATITVPAGKRWKLCSAAFLLTTSATAMNRYAYVTIAPSGGANVSDGAMSAIAQEASQTNVRHIFAIGAAAAGLCTTGNQEIIPLSDADLPAGAVIQFGWVGLQVGDDAGLCRYEYKEVTWV